MPKSPLTGSTPLHEAIALEARECAEFLHSTWPLAWMMPDASGLSPLHLAAHFGATELVALFLQRCSCGGTSNSNAAASGGGGAGAQRTRQRNGAENPSGQPPQQCALAIMRTAVEQATALHLAAQNGRLDVLKLLLAHCPLYVSTTLTLSSSARCSLANNAQTFNTFSLIIHTFVTGS